MIYTRKQCFMFYVYLYMDPRKIGNYSYGEFSFINEPIYVGKGKGSRDRSHLSKCSSISYKKGSYVFYDKLNKINSTGNLPIIKRIKEFDSEEKALLYEKNLIKLIGRKSLLGGPLLNLTEGGIGGDTFSGLSIEQKRKRCLKMSNSMRGKNKGKPVSEEQRNKIRNSLLGRKNPEHSKKMKGRKQTKNHIEKASKGRLKNKEEWDRVIIQYTIDNIMIKKWNNYREIKEAGYYVPPILKSCRKNKGITSKSIWRWE